MGLLSGRSRKTSRRTVSERGGGRDSARTLRGVDGDQVDTASKPDLQELRRRRDEYYSIPPSTRRRLVTSTAVKPTTKRSSVTSLHAPSDKRRSHRTRHKSSSIKSESKDGSSRSRTEDYVYGPRATQTSAERDGMPLREEAASSRSTRKASIKSSSSDRRRSLPTVFEAEITPDDSISQVGARIETDRAERLVSSRPSIRRSKTTSSASKLPTVPELREDAVSSSRSKKSSRTLSSLGSFSRRFSTPAVPTPPRLIECLTCGSDDVPSTQSAKLACGHRMCHECLKRIFDMSVKDPHHMPPKCCGNDHIPLKHVDKLFDVKFKMLWNRKYQEYHTKNRIYCPAPKCGEWIKPSHVHTSQGRKYAQCPRCKIKVCTLCNNKLHKSSDCPEDPEIAKLVEQAKEKGWQRCYSCNALVERKEGCNHMTCRCMAEFCIVCGLKWKTCECPWFNYSNLPNPDRLNDMRVPEPIQVIYRHFFNGAANPAGHAPAPAQNNAAPNPRRPHDTQRGAEVTYQQELDQRRRQERLDADLARRLQLASLWEPEDGNAAQNRPDAEVWGVGNAAGNFMGDNFVQNAANVIMNTFGDATVGRRGERQSARRRRSAQADARDRYPGLAPDFLGDESVLGTGPESRSRRVREGL